MPDFTIPSFKYGMDQRRARAAGAISTLWDLQNAHITRGGDVQACKAFVPTYTLPAGCFGLVAIGSTLFTFGSANPPTMPPGVVYQQLSFTSPAMTRVITAVAFIGNTYVIAEYNNGDVLHFYNGSRVTDWDAISAANCSLSSLASYLAGKVDGDPAVSALAYGSTLLLTSRVPGVTTTVTASNNSTQTAVVATVQAAVAGASEIPSQGSITITAGAADGSQVTQITIGGVSVMQAPVAWLGSNAVTANAVAAQINNMSSASGYFASALGNAVSIFGNPGHGATPNGKVVAATVTGSVSASTVSMSGGAAPVTAIAQVVSVALGGTLDATSTTTVTVGGNAYLATTRASGIGLSAYVFENRIYSCANTHLQYCTIANPADWSNTTPSSGAGFINIASQTNGSERLVMVGAYAGYAAIFSARAVRLYQLTTDATAVTSFQSMQNQGSIAPLSLQSFATTDVFYLDLSGIRSLRERDTTFTAYAADVGSAVDTPVQNWIVQVGSQVAFNAQSVVEPLDGRYWLAIGSRIWVYSYFPSTQVGAWSHYDPGFSIQAFAVIKEQVYCYDGTTVYLYGGSSGQQYPAAGVTPPTFTTPFHNPGNSGSTQKIDTTVELVATGTWTIKVFLDPNNLGSVVNGGTIVNNTYQSDSANIVGQAKLFSLQMTCVSGGYADFSSFTINYLQKAAK